MVCGQSECKRVVSRGILKICGVQKLYPEKKRKAMECNF